jgi:hypothetical protein
MEDVMKVGRNAVRSNGWIWWLEKGIEIGVHNDWAQLGEIGRYVKVDVEDYLASWECPYRARATELVWERSGGKWKCRVLCIEEGPYEGRLIPILEEAWKVFDEPDVWLYVPREPWQGIVKAMKYARVVGFTKIIPWPLLIGWKGFVTRPA